MFVSDFNLAMRFKRQPRVLGTLCRYVPSNSLLHHKKLDKGVRVRIVGYPDNKNDLFVDVVEYSRFRAQETAGKYVCSIDFILLQGFTEEQIYSVMWKDLAQ